MQNKFICILAIAGFFFIACQEAKDPDVKTEATNSDKRNVYTGADGKTVGIDVKLDNGAKWEANVETTNEIGAMVGMVKELPANPSDEDYKALQKKLAISFQTILQKCTMKGEAHEQLHHYLMPLKEKIEKLKNSDLATSKKLASDIKDYLLKYSHFFYT